MTHTPGPWKFRPVVDERAGIMIALHLETEHRPVPQHNSPTTASLNDPVILSVRDDWMSFLLRAKRGQADARLIAASPELKDALHGLVVLADAMNARQHAGIPLEPEDWSEVYQATNAAKALLASLDDGKPRFKPNRALLDAAREAEKLNEPISVNVREEP